MEHTYSSKAPNIIDQAERQESKELQECTFRPSINPRAKIPIDNSVPKGYYQMVNRIRKVNNEKKALEEK